MEKEKVFEIEFKEVWDDKWAWRVVKNDIPYSKELKKIQFKRIKIINTHKNSLFFLDSFEDGYEQLEDFELILTNEKLELEDFVKYINKKYGISKRWRAEEGGIYWFIDTDFSGKVRDLWDQCSTDENVRYNLGNYFKTEKEAQKVKEELDKFWAKVRAGEIGEENNDKS